MNQEKVNDFFLKIDQKYVVHAAAKAGGILAKQKAALQILYLII